MFQGKKDHSLVALLLFTLLLFGCSNTPIPVQTRKTFHTKIEYYFDFIGKPAPSNFKPTQTPRYSIRVSNFAYYEPPDNYPTFMGEHLTLVSFDWNDTVKDVVIVKFIKESENESDYENWLISYFSEAKILGYRYRFNDIGNQILFTKEGTDFEFDYLIMSIGGFFTFRKKLYLR
jgi:hypothetical protein